MTTSPLPADTKALPKPPPRTRRGDWRGVLGTLRPPRTLAALLALTLLLGIAWTLVTPPFQAPDENAHFAYVQLLAERFELPGRDDRPVFSTEQLKAGSASNSDQAAAVQETRMEWSKSAYERWRAGESRQPRTDAGGPNPASSNPPLYYLYEVPAYRLGEGADQFTRLQLARIASVLWLLVTVTAVWLLAGELFGTNRLLQLAAAGTAALAPMMQFVSASVTPDAMLFGLWSVALWLGVRTLKRGLTPTRAAALFAVVGIACTVKATSFALLPGALLVVVLGDRRWREAVRGRRVATIAAALGALALTLGAWLIIARLLDRPAAAQVTGTTREAHINARELLSYVWQFYLPRLPFQTAFSFPYSGLPVYSVWLTGAWAAFGWLEVKFPSPVYALFAAISVVVLAAAVWSLWRCRRSLDRAVLAFLALVAIALVAGLHWTEYRQFAGGAGPFAQGRYLLPLIGLAGLAVAQVISSIRQRWRAAGVAAVLSGLFVLDVFSLALMLERFYA
jgi:4-amino-4-deoxy-L-arabinose transferase-like glycosyltransferase